MGYVPYQERYERDSRLGGKVTALAAATAHNRGSEPAFPADRIPSIIARAKQELADQLGMKLDRIEIRIQF